MDLDAPFIISDDDDSISGDNLGGDSHTSHTKSPTALANGRQARKTPRTAFSHHASVQLPLVAIPEVRRSGFRLRPSDGVEFQDKTGQISLFLKICLIIKDLSSDEVVLRGHVYKRNQAFGSMLSWKVNEVCAELEVEGDDTRLVWAQAMVDVPLERVLKKRRIEVTELDFPHKSWRDYTSVDSRKPGGREILQSIAEHDRLASRYVHVTFYPDTVSRLKNEKPRHFLRRVMAEDLVEIASLRGTASFPPTDLRVPGGSRQRKTLSAGVPPSSGHRPASYITYGDGFCGGGGSLRGAMMGGVQAKWAFDKDGDACASCRLNAPCPVFEASIDQFLESSECTFVDILHLSPPCQPFSHPHYRATQHTRDQEHFLRTGEIRSRNARNEEAEEKDDLNRLALYSIGAIIERVKPRIVTLEQTSGLPEKHLGYLQTLIWQFIDLGYSPMWAVVDFAEYESVQRRRRLVIVASAPGVQHPGFPPATHGSEGSGKKLWTTVYDVLYQTPIPSSATHYEVRATTEKREPSYDPTERCRINTITTAANFFRPDGEIGTIREFAAIGGFPHDHKFAEHIEFGKVRKQIGNAVPPISWQHFIRHIKAHLESLDSSTHSTPRRSNAPFPPTEVDSDVEIVRRARSMSIAPAAKRRRISSASSRALSGSSASAIIIHDSPEQTVYKRQRMGIHNPADFVVIDDD